MVDPFVTRGVCTKSGESASFSLKSTGFFAIFAQIVENSR